MNNCLSQPLLRMLVVAGIILLACSLPFVAVETEPLAAPQELPASPIEPSTPSEAPGEPASQAPPGIDAQGCTHYVSLDGNDGNTGVSGQPWRTIQHAANFAVPGFVVCITAGTYEGDGGVIRLANSGTAEQPVTVTSHDGDVVIEGMVDILQGTSHLQLHDLTIRNTGDWGITLYGDNEDIILSGLEVAGGEAAVHFTIGDSGEDPRHGPVDNIVVRDSVFHDVIYTAVDCTPGPCNDMVFQNLEIYGAGMGEESSYGSDGLAVERGQNILVEDCYIHDNSGDGIDLNSRDTLLGEDAGKIIVRRNRVENNLLNGIKVWRGGEVSNNIVWNMGNTLLVLERGSNYLVINNTFATSTEQVYLATIGYDSFPGTTHVTLFNNIFYNDDPAMGGTLLFVSEAVDLEAGHNLYFNPYREEDVACLEDDCFNKDQINDGIFFAQTGVGENSLYDDPLFSDPGNGDLHPAENSPVHDAGSADHAPPDDLEGNVRPSGVSPDIGSYESE